MLALCAKVRLSSNRQISKAVTGNSENDKFCKMLIDVYFALPRLTFTTLSANSTDNNLTIVLLLLTRIVWEETIFRRQFV